MKRMILLVLLISLTALPMQTTLAQGNGPAPLPVPCQPESIMNVLMSRLESMNDFDDALSLLELIISTAERCAEYWIQYLVELLLMMQSGGMMGSMVPMPPEPIETAPPDTDAATEDGTGAVVVEEVAAYDPDDGVMSTDEAEYAINLLASGDVATANQFFCENDQVAEEEINSVSITLTSVSCRMIAGKISCTISGELNDEAFTQTTIFTIVDGKLCESSTDD